METKKKAHLGLEKNTRLYVVYADIDIMGLLLLPLPVLMVYYVDNTLFSTTKIFLRKTE